MNRILVFLYGIVCYVIFFGTFLYSFGFVGNLLVPKGIDSGVDGGFTQALLINLGLLGVFAVQHTIMARPAFKKWWTRIIPEPMERSTFVLITSLLLILIYWQWRPMTGEIWNVDHAVGTVVIQAVFWLGWGMVLISTFLIDHFDLFGLRQVFLYLKKKEYTHVKFKTTALYKFVRHPIMLGFIIAFWATPHMTTGHLVFAIATTVYIFMGVRFEEHDLSTFIGKDYEEYRSRVPMIVPFTKKHSR